MLKWNWFLDFSPRDLRTGSGDGKLKTSKRSGRVFPMTHMKDGKRKMRFGDARGNVHPAQTMICTIFIKNHNDIAENLGKCFVLMYQITWLVF